MKLPQKVARRSEEELQKLDLMANQASSMSKSLSVTSSVFHSPVNEQTKVFSKNSHGSTLIIESLEDLRNLTESDFTMNVTIRNARTYKFQRVLISPNLTNVWDQNTRASIKEPDVSDIIDSIRSNGTNIVPAFGQFNSSDKSVLLIAGTRRRFATLKADVLLTMDLYYGEMSERDKHVIMHVENVRQEPDPFLKCRAIARLLQPIKGQSPFKDQTQLATFYGVTRVHINHQVQIGRLPVDLVDKISDRSNVTLERAGKFARDFLQLQKNQNSLFQDLLTELSNLEAIKFAELVKLIQRCSNSNREPVKTLPKVSGLVNTFKSGNLYRLGNDNFAIEIPKLKDEDVSELTKLIANFLENKI